MVILEPFQVVYENLRELALNVEICSSESDTASFHHIQPSTKNVDIGDISGITLVSRLARPGVLASCDANPTA